MKTPVGGGGGSKSNLTAPKKKKVKVAASVSKQISVLAPGYYDENEGCYRTASQDYTPVREQTVQLKLGRGQKHGVWTAAFEAMLSVYANTKWANLATDRFLGVGPRHFILLKSVSRGDKTGKLEVVQEPTLSSTAKLSLAVLENAPPEAGSSAEDDDDAEEDTPPMFDVAEEFKRAVKIFPEASKKAKVKGRQSKTTRQKTQKAMFDDKKNLLFKVCQRQAAKMWTITGCLQKFSVDKSLQLMMAKLLKARFDKHCDEEEDEDEAEEEEEKARLFFQSEIQNAVVTANDDDGEGDEAGEAVVYNSAWGIPSNKMLEDTAKLEGGLTVARLQTMLYGKVNNTDEKVEVCLKTIHSLDNSSGKRTFKMPAVNKGSDSESAPHGSEASVMAAGMLAASQVTADTALELHRLKDEGEKAAAESKGLDLVKVKDARTVSSDNDIYAGALSDELVAAVRSAKGTDSLCALLNAQWKDASDFIDTELDDKKFKLTYTDPSDKEQATIKNMAGMKAFVKSVPAWGSGPMLTIVDRK